MDALESFGIDWRSGVVLLAVLVGVYLVYSVLRLARLGRARRVADLATPFAAPVTVSPAPSFSAGGGASKLSAEPMIDLSADIPDALLAPPRATPPVQERLSAPSERMPERIQDTQPDFARALARSSVEAELSQLRRESLALREEVAQLREELASIKAARNVSPLYSEAMALAQQGAPAAGIAGQCGISLAEAELVAALARGHTEDEPDEYGEDSNDAYPEPGNRSGTHG